MRSYFSPVAPALLAVAFAFSGSVTSRADEALRRVQQSLRDQGFYYGTIDGSPGDETTQALKRYQIRNGLAVTGQLNDETRNSIARTGKASANTTARPAGSASSHPSAPVTESTPPPLARDRAAGNAQPDYRLAPREAAQPPAAPARRNTDDDANDDEETTTTSPAPGNGGPQGRPDLRVYPPEAAGNHAPSARYGSAPSPGLTALFERSPYEFAPPAVQADVLRRAQSQLLRSGFYDGEADGIPGAQTAEAIANFQEVNRLRRTGRMDINTLAAMRLLPARRMGPPRYFAPRPSGIYEGRIVQ